jgi:hypothetical protein
MDASLRRVATCHPERSEGSCSLGSNHSQARSLAALGMTGDEQSHRLRKSRLA